MMVEYKVTILLLDHRFLLMEDTAFQSNATNLVAGDTNGFSDIFAHDRDSNTIERVSVDTLGGDINANAFQGIISADGICKLFFICIRYCCR
ncbi:MAG: hypothetical protein R3B65_03155 [Candidatus Paceibacterota bacterium]